MSKTIREWYNMLPWPLNIMATNNMTSHGASRLDQNCNSLPMAINSFSWSRAPESGSFWSELHNMMAPQNLTTGQIKELFKRNNVPWTFDGDQYDIFGYE